VDFKSTIFFSAAVVIPTITETVEEEGEVWPRSRKGSRPWAVFSYPGVSSLVRVIPRNSLIASRPRLVTL